MKRSGELLDIVNLLLDNKLLAGIINDLYFICYHAANASLVSIDIYVKDDLEVLELFNKHFAFTGIVDKESCEFYYDIYKKMEEYDFGLEVIDYPEVELRLMTHSASKFFDQIQKILSNK